MVHRTTTDMGISSIALTSSSVPVLQATVQNAPLQMVALPIIDIALGKHWGEVCLNKGYNRDMKAAQML